MDEVTPFETDSSFKPTPQTARLARRISLTELPELGAGVEILGTAHGGDRQELEASIASVGGTHFVAVEASSGEAQSGVVVRPNGTWADTPSSACARAPTADGARPICAPRNGRDGWVVSESSSPGARSPEHWLVLSVPVERWGDLAERLRPSPATP